MFTWDDKPHPFPQQRERRQAMYRKELEDRAALLMRLGHSAGDVKTRLKKTVAWDFDLQDKPKHAAEVDRIVESVYKRNHK
jgi:hypothetical protein